MCTMVLRPGKRFLSLPSLPWAALPTQTNRMCRQERTHWPRAPEDTARRKRRAGPGAVTLLSSRPACQGPRAAHTPLDCIPDARPALPQAGTDRELKVYLRKKDKFSSTVSPVGTGGWDKRKKGLCQIQRVLF